MLSDEILKSCLAGKTFRTNQAIEERGDDGQPVMMGDKPKMTYVPHVRPMTSDDVLNSYEAESQYVVISKDGTKHRIEKGQKKSGK